MTVMVAISEISRLRQKHTDRLLTLLAVLFGLAIFAFAPLQAVGIYLFQGFAIVALLAIIGGIIVISENRAAVAVMAICFVANVVIFVLRLYFPPWPYNLYGLAGAWLAIAITLGVVVAQAVFRRGRVTYHRIVGAILLYLLIAVAFGTLFIFVGLPFPDAFKGITFEDNPGLANSVFYLSFVTLTSTGYGDIVPVHPKSLQHRKRYWSALSSHVVGKACDSRIAPAQDPSISLAVSPLLWWIELTQINASRCYRPTLYAEIGRSSMNLTASGWSKLIVLTIGVCLAVGPFGPAAATSYKSKQIRVEYETPKNPVHQPIYERLKKVRALEHLQTLLGPLRLPRPLLLKVSGCDGESNAWYEEGFVTVCYEFLADILKNALDQTLPSIIAQDDAILGPFLDVFLHETGHAVFDQLNVPVLGREEDAADLFSAYIMLQLGKDDARRLILGNAYQYKEDVVNPQVPLTKYADEHGIPAQRFFNVLCLAYGADQKLFADVVEKEYLPKKRAEGCDLEYEQATFAFKTLIGPYIDRKLAKKVLATWMRDVSARPKSHPAR